MGSWFGLPISWLPFCHGPRGAVVVYRVVTYGTPARYPLARCRGRPVGQLVIREFAGGRDWCDFLAEVSWTCCGHQGVCAARHDFGGCDLQRDLDREAVPYSVRFEEADAPRRAIAFAGESKEKTRIAPTETPLDEWTVVAHA